MKRLSKILSLLCMLAMALGCLGLTTLAEESAFAGGSGTEADPWQIETADQLAYLAATVNDGSCGGYAGQYFVLTADIDLAGMAWSPIGNMNDMENHTTLFLGSFDGQGYKVSNLSFKTDAFIVGAGLFGLSTGEIRNVCLENVSVQCIEGTSMAIAALVGYSMGIVENCTVTNADVLGNNCVGGVIGGCLEMMDSITNCTVDVTITAKGGHAIGGLCGYAGTHTNGLVAAETEGVVTTQYPGVIENCTVNTKIEAPEATHVGGLVGTGLYYYGEETAFAASNCTVNGEISAVTPGALAGRGEGCTFENCTANVTMNGEALPEIGVTDRMYESADQ